MTVRPSYDVIGVFNLSVTTNLSTNFNWTHWEEITWKNSRRLIRRLLLNKNTFGERTISSFYETYAMLVAELHTIRVTMWYTLIHSFAKFEFKLILCGLFCARYIGNAKIFRKIWSRFWLKQQLNHVQIPECVRTKHRSISFYFITINCVYINVSQRHWPWHFIASTYTDVHFVLILFCFS